MPGIGVILNPYSKKYKKDPTKAKKMSFIVGDKASCRATDDLGDLRRVAEEFKTRDIDILAISGGDGTIHCTLTNFIEVYGEKPLPKIAFLRGGTLNNVAYSLGIKGNPENILSSLLMQYHGDIPLKTKQLMLTKINNEYGFIFGCGFVFRFMEFYYKKGDLSPLGALTTLIHTIWSSAFNGKLVRHMCERTDGEVIVNGKKWPYANYSAIYTGSINQLGLNARISYLVDQYPNQFHALGFSTYARNVVSYVPWMYRGVPSGCPNLIEQPATEMIINMEKPLGYTIDGDMKAPVKEFKISCGPMLTVLAR